MSGASNEKMSEESILTKIDRKIDEKFVQFKFVFVKEIKASIIEEFKKILHQETKKIEVLESTVKMLQQQITVLKEKSEVNHQRCQTDHEELEQYGRRLCLRIDGVPCQQNETSDDVLEKVVGIISDAKCDIPGNVLDRAHRIGPFYKDKKSGKDMRSIIVRFSTFRHRSLLYKSRRNLKNNISLKLDLTRFRYKTLVDSIKLVSNHESVNYVFADINCRLKIVFKDGTSNFFNNLDELKKMLNNSPE